MKKNLFIIAVLLLNIISLNALCQNAEGEIDYSASLMSDMMPDMSKTFPLVTMKFKGDKETMSMDKIPGLGAVAMPFEKAIYDFKTKEVDMLVDKDGKKYDVTTTQDEVTNALKNKAADSSASSLPGMGALLNPDSLKVSFTPTDSIVTIMGYKCHKYTGSNSMMKIEAYASDANDLPQEMAGSLSNMMNGMGMGGGCAGIKGFIVKMVMHMNTMGIDMEVVMAVSKVAFKKESDSEFEIPKSYKKVTFKEYQQIMTGNYIEK